MDSVLSRTETLELRTKEALRHRKGRSDLCTEIILVGITKMDSLAVTSHNDCVTMT
jgi:hypothetical protein